MYQGCVCPALQRQSFPFDTTVLLVLFSSRGFCASQPRAETSHPETDEKQNKSGALKPCATYISVTATF